MWSRDPFPFLQFATKSAEAAETHWAGVFVRAAEAMALVALLAA